MLEMGWFFGFFLLALLGLTGAGQESIQFLEMYDATPVVHQKMSRLGQSFAVPVSDEELDGVSSSVLKAETWLRTHVLAHFPAAKITTIVVGGDAICKQSQDHNLGLVLPSLKNLFHSLTRWGLEKDIKVSVAFTSSCINPSSAVFEDGLVEEMIKPLQEFLHRTDSTYSMHVPSNFSPLSDEIASLRSSHAEFVQKFGSFVIDKMNVIVTNQKHQKIINRKLSNIDPVPAKPKPNPLPETAQPPLHSSVGFSAPANIARNPFPPLAHVAATPPLFIPRASPPEMSHSFAPEEPPLGGTAAAPYGYSLPPCDPAGARASAPAPAPAPETVVQQLWCVAKPSVPAETLQEAMDYACGEGGADCSEIGPQGGCFYPDTVVAHASFAFNSYWQKTKRNGGTCSFGGTAMLINADPSFLHCRFALS